MSSTLLSSSNICIQTIETCAVQSSDNVETFLEIYTLYGTNLNIEKLRMT